MDGLCNLSTCGIDIDLLVFGGVYMIEFKNVSFSYDATPEIKSLKDFSLAVRNGECVLITGASGCGKSTLLRLLNGLIPEFYSGETEGSIYIDGEDIQKDRIEDKAGIIGTVFQNPRSQFFNVDTTSELAFGLENLAFPEQEILNRISRTVRNFHIKPLMDRSIFELSGGEKQKIACASIDVLAPGIILLDEPSANLDYKAAEDLRELIICWKNAGKTILIAEHRINYVWGLVDRVIILENGTFKKEIAKNEINCFTEDDTKQFGMRSLKRVAPTSLARTNTNSDDYILLKDFNYSYDKKHKVFSIKEMKIPKGKVTAIIGTNGAGKTTFLESICGIRKNNGIMFVDGIPYTCKKRVGKIFMVMQDVNHQLFTESVLDEVLISQPREKEEEAKKLFPMSGSKLFMTDTQCRFPGGKSRGSPWHVPLHQNCQFFF